MVCNQVEEFVEAGVEEEMDDTVEQGAVAEFQLFAQQDCIIIQIIVIFMDMTFMNPMIVVCATRQRLDIVMALLLQTKWGDLKRIATWWHDRNHKLM